MDRLLSMRVFRKVVDEGGFAAAARALDLSPAVVTRLVADLERHLGTRLIQRTTRRLAITEAGAAYAERVKAILAEIDEAEGALAEAQGEPCGTLLVAAPAVLATQFFAPIAAAFRLRHPGIGFELHVGPPDEGTVEGHDLTLLITRSDFDRAVVARHITDADVMLVASPGYLRRKPPPATPAELAGHDCLVLRNPGAAGRQWTLTSADDAAQRHEVRVAPVLASNSSEVLLQAAMHGAGIAPTTPQLAGQLLESGELVRVLPGWVLGRYTVYAALPSRRYIPRRVQLFLDFMANWNRG